MMILNADVFKKATMIANTLDEYENNGAVIEWEKVMEISNLAHCIANNDAVFASYWLEAFEDMLEQVREEQEEGGYDYSDLIECIEFLKEIGK